MSECWHYIHFGTISDGIITGMHCSIIPARRPRQRESSTKVNVEKGDGRVGDPVLAAAKRGDVIYAQT